MRGRPRARLSRTGSVGDIGVSSPTGSGLTSARWSSVSSILGTISSDPSRETTRSSDRESAVEKPVVSKVGVSAGDSLLDDMEGWGEELVLRRACAADGGWPKFMVEIIRADERGCGCGWLPCRAGQALGVGVGVGGGEKQPGRRRIWRELAPSKRQYESQECDVLVLGKCRGPKLLLLLVQTATLRAGVSRP